MVWVGQIISTIGGFTMGKIHLNILGNAFHSFMLPKLWKKFDQQHGSIPEIGRSQVPVSMSFQALDFVLWPWLKDVLNSHPSLEQTNGTFSHALTPLMHPKHQQWQIDHSANRNHPVCAYPEFYSPESQFINKAFLVLASQTVAYSVSDTLELDNLYTDEDIARSAAINYGGKTGLVMKGFEPIQKAFYAWQRDPSNQALLSALMTTIQTTAQSNELTMMPIDIEAPYVGSCEPDYIWKTFFAAINKHDLAKHFISLSEAMELLSNQTQKSRRPHRVLGTKWTKYEVQWRYQAKLMNIEPRTERDHMILSIAGGSDVLSALGRKIEAPKKIPSLSAKNLNGDDKNIILGFSQDVLDISHSAAHALFDRKLFASKLERSADPSSLLTQRILAWAQNNNL